MAAAPDDRRPLRAALGWLGIPLLVFAAWRGCPDPGAAADVPKPYRFLFEGAVADDEVPEILAALPYERIELEEFQIYFFSTDRYEVSADGRAAYEVSIFGSSGGPVAGDVNVFDYATLCWALESGGFEGLDPVYKVTKSSHPLELTFRAWPTGGGEPILVEAYLSDAPLGLRAIRAAIHGTVRGLRPTRER